LAASSSEAAVVVVVVVVCGTDAALAGLLPQRLHNDRVSRSTGHFPAESLLLLPLRVSLMIAGILKLVAVVAVVVVVVGLKCYVFCNSILD